MKKGDRAQHLPLPFGELQNGAFRAEPPCACKSQATVTVPRVHTCIYIKGYCLSVVNNRIFFPPVFPY